MRHLTGYRILRKFRVAPSFFQSLLYSPLSYSSISFLWVQSKNNMKRTKKVLQLGTFSYEILLLLMSAVGHDDVVKLVRMATIGLGLTACGSVAAKVSVWTAPLTRIPESSPRCHGSITVHCRFFSICIYVLVDSKLTALLQGCKIFHNAPSVSRSTPSVPSFVPSCAAVPKTSGLEQIECEPRGQHLQGF